MRNKDIKINIEPKNAKQIVEVCSEITKAASLQLGFKHPNMPHLDYVSFCMLMDDIEIDSGALTYLSAL